MIPNAEDELNGEVTSVLNNSGYIDKLSIRGAFEALVEKALELGLTEGQIERMFWDVLR
jgi:hypothetical protein